LNVVESARRLGRVAVDLADLAPNGGQGGARVAALGLLRRMVSVAPEVDFTLLTSSGSHAELEFLEGDNVQRSLAREETSAGSKVGRVKGAVRDGLSRTLSGGHTAALRRLYWETWSGRQSKGAVKAARPDLLFSPFTSTSLASADVPLVAVVHDLQHAAYPRFFTPEQIAVRQRQIEDVAERAARIVCVSGTVRDSLVASVGVEAERVTVIHHTLFEQPPAPSVEEGTTLLGDLGLEAGDFYLYPANFWPHKNHAALLEAVAAYRRHPLVCTGWPSEHLAKVTELAGRLGIEDLVRFPGYVSGRDLVVLLRSCRALVYPSLFEGFGLPLLEAMALGAPIVCSRAASLPEVAADAALYFDPVRPMEIVNAFERLDDDPTLRERLVACGEDRLRAFGTPEEVARRYLSVFEEAVGCRGGRR
jgi:glycosyltransferase involved in cell wall biosynthesis